MKLFEDAIRNNCKVLPGDVLKIDHFLNHQLDVNLLNDAAALLAKVDTSKSDEELQQDSAYIEYMNLIDQSPEIDNGDTDIPTSMSIEALIALVLNIINFIKNILVTVFGI